MRARGERSGRMPVGRMKGRLSSRLVRQQQARLSVLADERRLLILIFRRDAAGLLTQLLVKDAVSSEADLLPELPPPTEE